LKNQPSKTFGFLHAFSSENHFFNTLLKKGGAMDSARGAARSCGGSQPKTLPNTDISQTCTAGAVKTIVA